MNEHVQSSQNSKIKENIRHIYHHHHHHHVISIQILKSTKSYFFGNL